MKFELDFNKKKLNLKVTSSSFLSQKVEISITTVILGSQLLSKDFFLLKDYLKVEILLLTKSRYSTQI